MSNMSSPSDESYSGSKLALKGLIRVDPVTLEAVIDQDKLTEYFRSISVDMTPRQRAIAEVAKANPSNIQEVAASQLALINSYYQGGLTQSQRSFNWSLIWGGLGFALLIAAICFVLFRPSIEATVVSIIAGAIVEVFAGTYLLLYRLTSNQFGILRASLEGTQRLLLANSMCEGLEGQVQQATRAEIVRLMVNSVVNTQEIFQTKEKK